MFRFESRVQAGATPPGLAEAEFPIVAPEHPARTIDPRLIDMRETTLGNANAYFSPVRQPSQMELSVFPRSYRFDLSNRWLICMEQVSRVLLSLPQET